MNITWNIVSPIEHRDVMHDLESVRVTRMPQFLSITL